MEFARNERNDACELITAPRNNNVQQQQHGQGRLGHSFSFIAEMCVSERSMKRYVVNACTCNGTEKNKFRVLRGCIWVNVCKEKGRNSHWNIEKLCKFVLVINIILLRKAKCSKNNTSRARCNSYKFPVSLHITQAAPCFPVYYTILFRQVCLGWDAKRRELHSGSRTRLQIKHQISTIQPLYHQTVVLAQPFLKDPVSKLHAPASTQYRPNLSSSCKVWQDPQLCPPLM